MVLKEIREDLFNLVLREPGTVFVQCISADLRMGRGIAEQFNDHFNVKDILMNQEPNYLVRFDNRIQYINGEEIDDAGIIKAEGTPVYNLVTKRNYWEKPTYTRGIRNCCDMGVCKRDELGVKPGERYELCVAVHAEANAIMQAGFDLTNGATLYLAGTNADGSDNESPECCMMCKRMILNAGIEKVYYQTKNGEPKFVQPKVWIKRGEV